MEYILIRSKRKSIGIRVSLEKGIEVRAPLSASEKSINKVVMDNREWILKTQERLLEQEKSKKNIMYEQGESLYLFGKLLEIQLEKGDTIKLVYENDKFVFTLTGEVINNAIRREKVCKTLFEEFLRATAKDYLTKRTMELATKYNFTINKITIKKVRTRWGSCSSKKNINLNLKLVMADPKAIDYVIIHELCHTEQLNHSKKFWELVGKIIPDYKEQQIYLKKINTYFDVLD